jgi:hypothetical protein
MRDLKPNVCCARQQISSLYLNLNGFSSLAENLILRAQHPSHSSASRHFFYQDLTSWSDKKRCRAASARARHILSQELARKPHPRCLGKRTHRFFLPQQPPEPEYFEHATVGIISPRCGDSVREFHGCEY